MKDEPSLYINKQAWYINFVGVDRTTGEIKQEGLPTDPQVRRKITEQFMKNFGYIRKNEHQSNQVKAL